MQLWDWGFIKVHVATAVFLDGIPSGHPPPTRCLQPGEKRHLCGHSIKWPLHTKVCREQRKAQIHIPNHWTSTCLATEKSQHNFLVTFWIQLIKYLAKNILVKKKSAFLKWKFPLGDILLWKQYLKIPLMFWPMPSVTCAVTIVIKPVIGRNMHHEEMRFWHHGHMLTCHTFIEIETSKYFMLLSVLCTHTALCHYAHSIAMQKALMLPEHCLNSVPPTTSIKSTKSRAGEGYWYWYVMSPERCYLFTIGKRIPGYSNAAMPSDGGVYTYSISEVQRLTNEPMGLQSIHLVFKYLNLSFSTVHCS